MNAQRLKELLSLGEGQRVEFKVNPLPDSVGEVVCGFLNTSGGYLILGFHETKGIIGEKGNPDVRLSELESAIAQHITPKAFVSFEVVEIEGKPLIVIEVPAGKDVPYAFRNSIYIRQGEKNQKADVETIRDLVMRRQIEPERWERRFSMADMEQDIDRDEVFATVADASKAQRTMFRNTKSMNDILEDLAVARYGRLTQGGDVLFTRQPQHRYPQVRARAMRYRSSRADQEFLNMKSFEGPLHQVFTNLFTFVLQNTPTLAQFRRDTPKRDDRPLYPETVIREALINALAHRDYASPSGGVAVHIYPDRVEFWNAGQFPEGVTPDKLMKGHLSILRNPDIAHVLYIRGLMEKAGRGSVLIVTDCRKAKLPSPEWTSGDEGVRLTLRTPEVTPEVTTDVTTDVTAEVTADVTAEVDRLIALIDGALTRRELQEMLGLKHDEHFRKAYLQPALEAGLIEMTIPDKPRSRNQKYRLTPRGRKLAATKGADNA